jgi:pimeloyl-ACP methyl ester carboxylesterase
MSFEVAVVAFGDDGLCSHPSQLTAALRCIEQARSGPSAGAVVLLFIHGWHHGSSWDDTHFVAFREVLKRLACREAERYGPLGASGRRVVGIYLSWNGDPENTTLLRAGWLSLLTFWNRYSVAGSVGQANDFRDALRAIILSAKSPDRPGPVAPLIMVGHSMGALVLESAFLSILESRDAVLTMPLPAAASECVHVQENGNVVAFPDLLLAVNSAADSEILKEILREIRSRRISKRVVADGIRYSPPLLISVTSEEDSDTGKAWRVARAGRRTDGHDPSLFTHTFTSTGERVNCPPRGEIDFGQNWHGLRLPVPPDVATPEFPIDLPARARTSLADRDPGHIRHLLTPIGDRTAEHATWVFQLPGEIVADHNDIFGYRSNTLLLALMQISGAVLSLAADWRNSFE